MAEWESYVRQRPVTGEQVYIAPSAVVIGKVIIGDQSSIWPNVSARGDVNSIKIGARTNIQDNTVLHVTYQTHPISIGDDVTVGHGCILHGCTIMERCLIGMGSVVLDGAVIGPNAMVGAGSVVKQGDVVPTGTLYLGVPAKYKRDLTEEELAAIMQSAEEYSNYAAAYLGLSL